MGLVFECFAEGSRTVLYDRLLTEDAADYDTLKDALLKKKKKKRKKKKEDMCECGFGKKFGYGRHERLET